MNHRWRQYTFCTGHVLCEEERELGWNFHQYKMGWTCKHTKIGPQTIQILSTHHVATIKQTKHALNFHDTHPQPTQDDAHSLDWWRTTYLAWSTQSSIYWSKSKKGCCKRIFPNIIKEFWEKWPVSAPSQEEINEAGSVELATKNKRDKYDKVPVLDYALMVCWLDRM